MSEEFNTIPSLETKPKNSKLVFILIALFALASFGFYYLFTSLSNNNSEEMPPSLEVDGAATLQGFIGTGTYLVFEQSDIKSGNYWDLPGGVIMLYSDEDMSFQDIIDNIKADLDLKVLIAHYGNNLSDGKLGWSVYPKGPYKKTTLVSESKLDEYIVPAHEGFFIIASKSFGVTDSINKWTDTPNMEIELDDYEAGWHLFAVDNIDDLITPCEDRVNKAWVMRSAWVDDAGKNVATGFVKLDSSDYKLYDNYNMIWLKLNNSSSSCNYDCEDGDTKNGDLQLCLDNEWIKCNDDTDGDDELDGQFTCNGDREEWVDNGFEDGDLRNDDSELFVDGEWIACDRHTDTDDELDGQFTCDGDNEEWVANDSSDGDLKNNDSELFVDGDWIVCDDNTDGDDELNGQFTCDGNNEEWIANDSSDGDLKNNDSELFVDGDWSLCSDIASGNPAYDDKFVCDGTTDKWIVCDGSSDTDTILSGRFTCDGDNETWIDSGAGGSNGNGSLGDVCSATDPSFISDENLACADGEYSACANGNYGDLSDDSSYVCNNDVWTECVQNRSISDNYVCMDSEWNICTDGITYKNGINAYYCDAGVFDRCTANSVDHLYGESEFACVDNGSEYILEACNNSNTDDVSKDGLYKCDGTEWIKCTDSACLAEQNSGENIDDLRAEYKAEIEGYVALVEGYKLGFTNISIVFDNDKKRIDELGVEFNLISMAIDMGNVSKYLKAFTLDEVVMFVNTDAKFLYDEYNRLYNVFTSKKQLFDTAYASYVNTGNELYSGPNLADLVSSYSDLRDKYLNIKNIVLNEVFPSIQNLLTIREQFKSVIASMKITVVTDCLMTNDNDASKCFAEFDEQYPGNFASNENKITIGDFVKVNCSANKPNYSIRACTDEAVTNGMVDFTCNASTVGTITENGTKICRSNSIDNNKVVYSFTSCSNFTDPKLVVEGYSCIPNKVNGVIKYSWLSCSSDYTNSGNSYVCANNEFKLCDDSIKGKLFYFNDSNGNSKSYVCDFENSNDEIGTFENCTSSDIGSLYGINNNYVCDGVEFQECSYDTLGDLNHISAFNNKNYICIESTWQIEEGCDEQNNSLSKYGVGLCNDENIWKVCDFNASKFYSASETIIEYKNDVHATGDNGVDYVCNSDTETWLACSEFNILRVTDNNDRLINNDQWLCTDSNEWKFCEINNSILSSPENITLDTGVKKYECSVQSNKKIGNWFDEDSITTTSI